MTRTTTAMAVTAVLLLANPLVRIAIANEKEADGLVACRAVAENTRRLECYDRLTSHHAPRFSGRLTATTDRFTISTPHILRYESDGPIFVMYLKNDAGDVLQNLHIGGGGQDKFVIEQPGTYFLTISGSETWRVWLEPK